MASSKLSLHTPFLLLSGNVVWDLVYVARGSLNVRTDYSMSDSLHCCLELDQALVIQMTKKKKKKKEAEFILYI